MDDVQPKYDRPSQRDMLLSLDATCFLSSWAIIVRCSCGREHQASLPTLSRIKLKDREKRTLGNLVLRLRCQDCGQSPFSVVAEHLPSRVREELLATG